MKVNIKKLTGFTRELLFKNIKLDLIFLVLAALLFAYVGFAVVLGSPRPFAPILSDSMEPYIHKGDLILIESIHPSKIEEEDVIVFRVEIPGRDSIELAHRVVRAEEDPAAGLIFWTKGDNRKQMDGFGTPASAVRGVVAHRVPILGYILMYFQSPPGWTFIGLTIFFYLIYQYGGRVTERLKRWDPGKTDPALLERLDRQDETMQEFREAISGFAKHIQSHTRIVQKIGDSAERLADVVEKLDSSIDNKEKKEEEKPKYRPWK